MTRTRTPHAAIRQTIEAAIAHVESDACIVWPHSIGASGYPQVQINNKKQGAHQYVCARVHGARPSGAHQAAHSCGTKACVNPHHLRWATPKENHADRFVHGTTNRGEKQWGAKLTSDDVREVRRLAGLGQHTIQSIADRFNVSHSTASDAIKGRTWSWLDNGETK